MSFDNGIKLRFFSASSPSNDFAISIVQGFTNSSATVGGLIFLEQKKATLQDVCNNGLSIGKDPSFLRYHSDESLQF